MSLLNRWRHRRKTILLIFHSIEYSSKSTKLCRVFRIVNLTIVDRNLLITTRLRSNRMTSVISLTKKTFECWLYSLSWKVNTIVASSMIIKEDDVSLWWLQKTFNKQKQKNYCSWFVMIKRQKDFYRLIIEAKNRRWE